MFKNTATTREDFIRRINAGEITTVAGRQVWSRFDGRPATSWQNGSVSVDVRGRSARTQGTVWVKEGQEVSFS